MEDMDIAIVRLVNNDRIIGFILDEGYDIVALYAPMQIKTEYLDISTMDLQDLENLEDGAQIDTAKGYYVYVPYDPLSAAPMVEFDKQHVLTYSVPNVLIQECYEKTWSKYYMSYSEYITAVNNAIEEEEETKTFTSDRVSELFSEFLKSNKNKPS